LAEDFFVYFNYLIKRNFLSRFFLWHCDLPGPTHFALAVNKQAMSLSIFSVSNNYEGGIA
jgi:hypothetical protein